MARPVPPAVARQTFEGSKPRPSLAFEKLAGFVAIQQTQRPDEVLRQLILQVVVDGQSGGIRLAVDLAGEISTLYGLHLSEGQIQAALDGLLGSQELVRGQEGALRASRDTQTAILKRSETARQLEERVRTNWVGEFSEHYAAIDPVAAWRALEKYLTAAFRSHGLLTVSLLDPAIEVPEEQQRGLRALLQEALDETCERSQHEVVAAAIRGFLLEASEDADRSAFISTLADCTVSYYTLTVPPKLRRNSTASCGPSRSSWTQTFCSA